MSNPPDCIPSGWAYTDEFWRVRNIAGDAIAYDHTGDAPDQAHTSDTPAPEPVPWYVKLTVWGTLGLILALLANYFF